MGKQVTYEGVILRKVPYRDHDLILGVFTKEDGKISVFVPGARKSTKRFGPYLDLFAKVQLVLKDAGHKMLQLQETSLIDPYVVVRESLFSLGFATYYAECLWSMLAEHDPHMDIFEHLCSMLKNVSQDKENFRKLYEYEYQLIEMCGYNPDFTFCGECKASVQGQVFFSYGKGSVMCKTCHRYDQGLMISEQTMQMLQNQGPLSKKSYEEIREVLTNFVSYTLGKQLKSHAFRKGVS